MPNNIYIDIEPTWEGLLKEAIRLSDKRALKEFLKELMPAMKIADEVRQSQKKGYKSVTFEFPNKRDVEIKHHR